METKEYVPHTTMRIWISHEEIQNMAHMSDQDGFDYIEEWYGIDSSRILSAEIVAEKTMAPILTLKIKQR